MSRESRVNIRVKESEAAELREVSFLLDIPSAQIVREAIREKIAEIKRTHPLLQKTEQAKANN